MITKKILIEKILETVYRDDRDKQINREFLEILLLSDLKKMYREWENENDKVK